MRKESLAWFLGAMFSIAVYNVPADTPIGDKLLLILAGFELATSFITEVLTDETVLLHEAKMESDKSIYRGDTPYNTLDGLITMVIRYNSR